MLRAKAGDLITAITTRGNCLGIVKDTRPREVVGAAWFDERYVIYWFDSQTTTTVHPKSLDVKIVSQTC